MRPRRSALYLPASNGRAIEKARGLDADVVILDLEDAVAPDAKTLAREQAVAAVNGGGFRADEVVVRINALSTEWGDDDLAALRHCDVAAVLVPKLSEPRDLGPYADALAPGVPLWAMIETPLGVFRAADIAAAGRDLGLACLVVGTNDLAKEARMEIGRDRRMLAGALATAVFAARAYGMAVLDGVYNDLDDLAGLEAECREARAFGFDGKTLIHPAQIAVCHRAFAPADEDIRAARDLLDVFALPENATKGAVRHNGRMVERLHLEAARRTLALAGMTS